MDGAANATVLSSFDTSPSASVDLRSMVSTLLTFSAMGDWMKLFVIGSALETCRRHLFRWRDAVTKRFWVTASFEQHDYSYTWVLYWLSLHPVWKEARTVEVSARNFGLGNTSEDEDDAGAQSSTSRYVSYLPRLDDTYTLWYKGHYMIVQREERMEGQWSTKETLDISILSLDRRVLQTLLDEARQVYREAERKTISIYAADTGGQWKYMTSRPKRPLSSIILDPGIKNVLMNDARDFLSSRKWYADRGVPFRRGYLLYGPPGTGKTSMIQSIAGELGLNVYVVTLSRTSMDDCQLNELISNMPRHCIALMEDIDAAFAAGMTRDLPSQVKQDDIGSKTQAKEKGKVTKRNEESTRITLSGLLNALDGIGAQEGRILFATTNNYGALDAALCRPGRMDMHIEFKLASRYQAENLYKCFYMPDSPGDADCPVEANEGYDSRQGSMDGNQDEPDNSGASELEDTPLLPAPWPRASQHRSAHASSMPSEPSRVICQAASLSNEVLSHRDTLALAARFAESIPERELSMASIQGYLMMYKGKPREAVDDVPQWVEKEKAARKQRM
ncbi:P-loop containing nucleoside triphosphate hydrolase protein [Daedalea quercina L-15889]|uniref:p-loop containing nucleoside triphosphate hydrolase protein n=1 Tax=Daedalea quercina L-15889 TaxID=1314783 RepID=A0A165N5V0_9APHY|nr:P-loop containing nucleoside triphosphate hydrolase protein [Daedalea quercina L-15889]